MRILMVNLVRWAHAAGEVQHQLGLLRAWRGAGHDIRMITPRSDDTAILNDIKALVRFSPNTQRIGFSPSLNTLLQIPVIAQERMRFRPDVVYSRVNMLTAFLVGACKLMGLHIVIEHNTWLASERKARGGHRLVAWIEERSQIQAARWADMSRCVTSGMADRLHAEGVPRSRLRNIGNGTDIEQFRPLPRTEALESFGFDPPRTYLGFIGSIMPWHGVEIAVEAFEALAASEPDIDLLIVGDGPQRRGFEARLRERGLGARAHFLGRVPSARANAAINCFDIALLPLSERLNVAYGFSSIKIRDYAAAGRLVVCGHLPGNIELAGQGWLFTHRPDDAASLAAALRERLADRQSWRAAARAARSYAETHFAWEVIAAQVLEMIRASLAEPSKQLASMDDKEVTRDRQA